MKKKFSETHMKRLLIKHINPIPNGASSPVRLMIVGDPFLLISEVGDLLEDYCRGDIIELYKSKLRKRPPEYMKEFPGNFQVPVFEQEEE